MNDTFKQQFTKNQEYIGNFAHIKDDQIHLDRYTKDNKRYYITPFGDFVSITTILGSFTKKQLEEWKKAVGEVEANKVSLIATDNGTRFHTLIEKYLNNEKITLSNPIHIKTFSKSISKLNRINNIRLIEGNLYSSALKIAGSVDCIAEFDGVLSVIDFKTSNKEKFKEEIDDYFIQCCAYSHMYYEIYGKTIGQIVIIILSEDNTQIFIEKTEDWNANLRRKLKDYRKNVN